ncbi:hypothetical protein GJ496_000441 [Pomphorhynchus laevis]|nr:hypothetical protein GJ496_000441 [Pomphorhynchus laevis]
MIPVAVDQNVCNELLEKNNCFIFDCDGVLWIDGKGIDDAVNALNYLTSKNKKVYFFTNNSTKSRSAYVSKLQKLGYNAKKEQIISTSWLVAEYLKSIDFKGLIYLVGSHGIAEELKEANFKFIGLGPDPFPIDGELDFTLDPLVNCVVAGFDSHISYPKIAKAASYIQKENCHFIVTNEDTTLPSVDKDKVIPGTGSVTSSIRLAVKKQPIVMGKPNSYAWKLLQQKQWIDPSTTLMIGDRLDTDISFGRNCGLNTMAVLTGVTSLSEIDSILKTVAGRSSSLIPNYYVNSITQFYSYFN